MASILSWAKKTAGTVKKDVQGAVAQVNPLDNNRTFKTVQQHGAQYAPRPPASAISQIAHSGPANFAGNTFAKPLVRSSMALNQGIGNAEIGIAHRFGLAPNIHTQNAPQFNASLPSFVGKNTQYRGTKAQIVGDAASNAINLAAPGSSKALEAVAGKVLPKVGAKIVSRAVVGAPVGAAGNVSGTLSQSDHVSAKDLVKTAAQGAALGAVIGGASPLAKPAARLAGKGAKAAGQKTADVALMKPHRNISDQQLAVAGKVRSTMQGGPISPMDLTEQEVKTYRNVQQKLGAKVNDHGAVDDALAKRLTWETNMQQKKAALQNANTRLNNYVQVGGSTKKVTGIAEDAPKSSAPIIPKLEQTPSTPKLRAGTSLGKNTAIDVNKYLKTQTQAQEIARKADGSHGFGKAKASSAVIKKNLVDSLAPIEDTLHQRVNASNASSHITPQLDRVLRADTIAGQYIKDNGLARVIQSAPNTKELDQYLIAKHAPAYEAEHGVGSSGRNLAADRQLVEQLAPKYEAHAQAVNAYSQKVLDEASNYGLISPETAQALKAKYPDYVPLNRVFGENELKTFKGNGSGKASISTQGVVKKGVGSQRTIESPLSSLIDKTTQLIKDGERNKAAQILTGYKDLPGNPFQLRELAKNETVGTKPVISVIDNGVTRRFETTQEIATAAKSLDRQQLDLVGQILAAPTRVLRLGATGINPAFALANVAKDTVSAFINSSHPLRSSVANPTVFVDSLKAALNHNSSQYGELVREGAGGTSFDIARNAPVENVKTIRAQKNVGTKVLYTVTHPSQLFRAVENTIGRSEEFNRAMQYYGNKQASLKAGNDLKTAQTLGAHAARNNTVNFARAGDYGRVANSVLPYLNAGVQGSRTLLRNLKERPIQTGGKLALTAFFPTAMVTAWNIGTPDRKTAYDDIKDYEKQGNLILVPPNPKKDANGKWNVIKIPVSQEIANLSNMVRTGVEAGMRDGSISLAGMLGDTVGTVTSLNAQSPRQIANQITPQAIKPGIESLTNSNLFTGNKIVPDSQKNLAPKDQIGKSTSGVATELGKFTGLSPRHIDNAIRTATGGTGQNVVHYTDQALAKAGVIKPNQVQGKSFQASVVGRFSGAQGNTPYDIADQKFGGLKKQLEANPQFKAMQPGDKAKALNRLQNSVTSTFVPKLNKDGSQKPLGTRQQAIASGKPDLSSYLTAQTGGKTKAPVTLTGDKRGSEFLNNYNALSSDRKKSWSAGPLDPKYKDVYDISSKIRPAGMPDLPKQNTTLKAYADYLKANQTAANELERNKARGDFLKTAYKASLTKSSQDLFGTGYTVASKIDAIKNGDISKDDLDNAIGLDNLFVKNGLTSKPSISKSVRAEFGYSTPSTGSGRGHSGRRRGSRTGRRVGSRKGIPKTVSMMKTPRINTKAKGFKSVSVKAPSFKSQHKSLPKLAAYKTPKVTKGKLA